MEQKFNVQYWVAFAVALAAMTASVSYSWTTPVIPKIHNNETEFNLTDVVTSTIAGIVVASQTEISWLVSSSSPGSLTGCLVSGYIADRFGRRATLLGSAFPFVVGTIFVITATNAWMLCMGRFFWSVGAGIIQQVSMIYITEIAAKEIRGTLSAVNRFMFTLGGFLVVAAGAVVSYQTLSCMLIALPVCYFGACWCVPETPYYLLKKGKIGAAQKSLMKLNHYNDEKILDEKLTQMRSHVREEMQRSGTVKELFTGKQYRKAITISIGLRTTQLMSGSIPLQQYLGRILQETNTEISVSTGLIVFSAMRFISSLLSSLLVDKIGRRPLLIYSYIGASLTLISLGALFFCNEIMHRTPNHFSYVTLTGLILFSTISTLGFDTVNFIIPAEIFPLNVKSTAMTCLNLFVSILTFVMVRGYQIMKDLTGLYGIFWFYGSFALAGAIFSYVLVPETKGKSLREIQIELLEKLDKNEENEIEAKEIHKFYKSEESIRLKA